MPDDVGRAAAGRFLALAHNLTQDDLLLFLMSGGASALLVEPAAGLALNDKQAITQALLRSGAPIDEMNCLRKHLSAIKGGRLAAAAYPARVATLAISDVPGDDPAVIGSGPTVGDPTSCADALKIADKRSIDLPAYARKALAENSWETIKPGDPVLTNATFDLIARPRTRRKQQPMLRGQRESNRSCWGPISRARLAISDANMRSSRNPHLPGSSFPVEKRPLRFQANMGAAAAIANIS